MKRLSLRLASLGILVAALMVVTPSDAAEPDEAEIEFWQSVKETAAPEELEAYLELYPYGTFAPLARIRLEKLHSSRKNSMTGANRNQTSSLRSTQAGRAANSAAEANHESGTGLERESSLPDHIKTREITLTLVPFEDPVRATKNPKRPSLGVEIEEAPGLGRLLGLNAPDALLLLTQPSIGINPGDLLIRVAGIPTPNVAALSDVIEQHSVGTSLPVTIAKLGANEEDINSAYARLAESNPEAAHALSFLIIESDTERSIELSRKSAEAGYAPAMYVLYVFYALGDFGFPKDQERAVRWLRKAAEQGHTSAAYSLALSYRTGDGIPKDDSEFFRWLRIGAERGDVNSMEELCGNYYFDKVSGHFDRDNSRVGAPDSKEALQWCRKAVEGGSIKAMAQLARVHDESGRFEQAADLFLSAYVASPPWFRSGVKETSKFLDSDTRMAVKRLLRQAGAYEGPEDGEFGPDVLRALEAYRRLLFAYGSVAKAGAKSAATPSYELKPVDSEFDLGDVGVLD